MSYLPDSSSHARRRALDRYGILLTNGDMCAIVRKIERGDCQYLAPGHGSTSILRVAWAGIPILMVYDPETLFVVTCLDPRTVFANGAIDWGASVAAGVKDRRRDDDRDAPTPDSGAVQEP